MNVQVWRKREKKKKRKKKREKKSHIYRPSRPSWHSTRSPISPRVSTPSTIILFCNIYIYIYWNFFIWNFDFFFSIWKLKGGLRRKRSASRVGWDHIKGTTQHEFFLREKRDRLELLATDLRSEDSNRFTPITFFFSLSKFEEKRCFNRPEDTVVIHHSFTSRFEKYQTVWASCMQPFDRAENYFRSKIADLNKK